VMTFVVFFFQAEDGIRDWSVTGVQTCALPICEKIGSVVRRADFLAGSQRPMTNRSFNLDSVRVKLLGDVAVITAITPFVRADGTAGPKPHPHPLGKRSGAGAPPPRPSNPPRRPHRTAP